MGNVCVQGESGPSGPDSFSIGVEIIQPNISKSNSQATTTKSMKVRVVPQDTFAEIKSRIHTVILKQKLLPIEVLNQMNANHGMTVRLARNFNGILLNLDDSSSVVSVGLKCDEKLYYQVVLENGDSKIPELAQMASNENSILALGQEESFQKYF
uniref:Uncharacterized protein n=1 Tax=Timspurckia oligopyrenoides TaxID=708627 RepID=A0A7S1EU64_9RHOD|mmetsp:Transcript_7523/g.13592  ORF Transcript_7523/g.13592 Transcript_7523/m.13592 type:complete len:155 (+) Transcript_7523:138-602(+)